VQELSTITLWNPEQFAMLLEENNGKYVFEDIRGRGKVYYSSSRYGRGDPIIKFYSLIQLGNFGPVRVELDMANSIPEPFELESVATGTLGFATDLKRDLVAALRVAQVSLEHVKKIKKVTLKEMFQITDNSEPEPKIGEEDNFETIIQRTVDKNVLELGDSPLGKVTMKVERDCQKLMFHLTVDWIAHLDNLILGVKRELKLHGLTLMEGKLQ